MESVKQTVRSTSTCSAATVLSLQTLFRSAGEVEAVKKSARATKSTLTSTTTSSRAKTSRTRTTSTSTSTARSKTPSQDTTSLADARLSNQEKLVLATEVFNTTLKTLSDAVKSVTSLSKEKRESSPAKRTTTKGRTKTSQPDTADSDNGVSAVAECARLSLSCLRMLKTDSAVEGGLPNLQLEQGACVLAGRLLALGLHETAYKELRGLKRRIQSYLDGLPSGRKRTGKGDAADGEEEAKERMSDLLSFSNVASARSVYGLLVSFQSNALRLIAAEKRPATVQKLVPSLQLADESSPANVIMAAIESGALTKDKAAVQLQLLSSTILSLAACGACTTKERLRPVTILTLQLLSLEIRCMSWKLSGHACEDNKEMWDPLARYIGAFAQATKSIEKIEFASIYKNIVRLQSAFAKTQNRTPRSTDNLSVARIATILGQLAQDAGCFDEALQLFTESLNPLSSGQCLGLATVRCKIAALYFQTAKSSAKLPCDISDAVTDATTALSLPLKGSTHDLDELLVQAAKLKKLAMGWFGDLLSKEQGSVSENATFPRVCEYLNGFIRFLRRYIGRRPADDELNDQITFQKRIEAAQSIILAAVDSAVAIGKLSVMSQRPPWDEIVPTLLDSQRILTTIESFDEADTAAADSIGLALVKLSNLFWSRYLKEKEAGKSARELLPLLKQSANLLSGCAPSQRATGFAPLKYERLAHTYVEAGIVSEAEIAFCQAISDHITAGALDNITSSTEGFFPYQMNQDPKRSGFTLGRVLSAYLKVKLRNRRSVADEIFDDETLTSVERGHILERQLGILTEIHSTANKVDIFQSVFSEVVARLLEVYPVEQHPLRRLRVVLCGLRFALEQPGCLDSSLLQQFVEEGRKGLDNDDYQGDDDIKSVAAYLKNSVRLTLSLQQGSLGSEELELIVSTWSSIVRFCRDLNSLVSCVGNVEYFLLQMKAVVDYTEIHGLWKFQLATLELVLCVTELHGAGTFSEAIIVLSRLVLQYCRLGSCTKARSLLNRADSYIVNHEVSCLARLSYELARVGFLLETGDNQKAASILSAARMLYEKHQSTEDLNACSVLTKIAWERLVADAAFMSSRLSFVQGSIKDALYFAKLSVRLNCRIWAKVEKLAQKKQEKTVTGDSSELEIVVEGMAKLEVSRTSSTYSQGAPFWPHIGSHHSSLLHLANLSAHHGLFQDAIYYGEQALKINKSLNANVRLIASQAHLGSHWILGGHIPEGQKLLASAKELSEQLESSIELVSLRLSLAALQRVKGDYRNEYRTLREAEKLLSGLFEEHEKTSAPELEDKMDKLRIRPKSGSTRQTTATATRRTRSATTSTSTSTSARSTPKPPSSAETTIGSSTLLDVKSEILRQQAASLRAQREFEKASNLLSDARKFAVTRDSKISVHIGESEHLLADAIRNFANHAVYCVLPESTISLPSLQPKAVTEVPSKSTTRRTRAPTRGTRSKPQPTTEDFSVMLSKAGDCLNDIFHTATHLGSTLDSHSASRLMSRISMLSHVTASQNQVSWSQSPANMNEIGRIGAFARERAAIRIDKELADYCDPLLWPRSKLESDDVGSDFIADYVDILPENWNVLSLSLSADQTEFVVSRLHQGRSPFLLRLPLRRGNSEDEEEQFTFEDGRDEMKELIRLANESAHAAKLQVDRQMKKEWWKNREALDRRMENLLQNIENVWFGGFRGIFSPIPHGAKSLARFASSFENILDKHLPSRQKGRRAEGPKLTLHPNVLELFVGVKDLDEQEDPEDALMDLLYFVVDILQFQGERNAYDEVDFDMMVVETLDAVRAYHEAASEEAKQRPNNTVLVLDKSLHMFPWESLPCLQGLPVCRVPSLECLRDRVLQFRAQEKNSLGIARRNGTYILNPTGDLQTTQGTFEKDLSSLKGWTGVVNRQPTEDEFKDSLESKDLFLYFGHGSGAQYIRGRTVKRLDRCAVAFLMGCSSGALTEAGEYEPYGTPMNYLQAGAPALVATLWDVTDKDIDRFAKATFEHWGLIGERGEVGDAPVALDAAVSQSRGACVLKYLNGAAPV
ncbi:C50 family peptidase [Aspergillus mulundensis]|uniref:separase n=1 Tax=Aspergillus mulundensis TaxID=1810919 RepID=A0A3D8QJ78_9EURO|nr:Separin [Aspergillus mulundensis]RDW61839.1 Separin [Aspergillus mulundensis]